MGSPGVYGEAAPACPVHRAAADPERTDPRRPRTRPLAAAARGQPLRAAADSPGGRPPAAGRHGGRPAPPPPVRPVRGHLAVGDPGSGALAPWRGAAALGLRPRRLRGRGDVVDGSPLRGVRRSRRGPARRPDGPSIHLRNRVGAQTAAARPAARLLRRLRVPDLPGRPGVRRRAVQAVPYRTGRPRGGRTAVVRVSRPQGGSPRGAATRTVGSRPGGGSRQPFVRPSMGTPPAGPAAAARPGRGLEGGVEEMR